MGVSVYGCSVEPHAPTASTYLLILGTEATDLLKSLITQCVFLLTGILQHNMLPLQLSVLLSQRGKLKHQFSPVNHELAVMKAESKPKYGEPQTASICLPTSKYHHPSKDPVL